MTVKDGHHVELVKKAPNYLFICILLILLVGCTKQGEEINKKVEVDGNVIAKVNNKFIFQSDYELLYKEYLSYFGGSQEAIDYLDAHTSLLFRELIEAEVLKQKADSLGISCSKEEAENVLEAIKKQYGKEDFEILLASIELSERELVAHLQKQQSIFKLQEGIIAKVDEKDEDKKYALYEEILKQWMEEAKIETYEEHIQKINL